MAAWSPEPSRSVEAKSLLPVPGSEPQIIQFVANIQTTLPLLEPYLTNHILRQDLKLELEFPRNRLSPLLLKNNFLEFKFSLFFYYLSRSDT